MLSVDQVLNKSQASLIGMHPVVKEKVRELIIRCYAASILILITSGFRSFSEQAAIFAKGRDNYGKVVRPKDVVSNARPGRSMHNYGLAADYVLLMPDGKSVSWSTVRDGNHNGHKDWFEVAEIAKSLGFEWGGDWDRFVDMPHIQMSFGLTIEELCSGLRPPTEQPVMKPKPIAISIKVNGKSVIDGTLINGAVFVPIRCIGEELGGAIGWDNAAKKPTINGELVMETAIINGSAFVPIRSVSEGLGANVIWCTAERSVTVEK
ncbi:M15 family metallopeptidase [Cohnella kolymensis]|uniref:M15 family metallopeptidase n=1 Tax=Cohnella kolymensis TaxID=1590652 RepID=UPI000698D0C9|nr:M15 family metallopeptidase [Cohnella kolymensis]